jgi:hypothetical protein
MLRRSAETASFGSSGTPTPIDESAEISVAHVDLLGVDIDSAERRFARLPDERFSVDAIENCARREIHNDSSGWRVKLRG